MYEKVKQKEPVQEPVNIPVETVEPLEMVELNIPPKDIKNRSLKGNKNYRKLRKDAKNKHLYQEVVKQLKKEVYNNENYPVDKHQFDHEIVIDAMQIVERVFNEPKLGDIKLKCVCEILKPYFLDNVPLIEKFVQLNFDKIIKSNVVRRYGIKIYDLCVNFFLGSSETK
jgi:hypothetical protein